MVSKKIPRGTEFVNDCKTGAWMHLQRKASRALEHLLSQRDSLVDVQMLHDTKEPRGWWRLDVGAERRVSCEHLQVLVTNLVQVTFGMAETPNGCKTCMEFNSTHRRILRACKFRALWTWQTMVFCGT